MKESVTAFCNPGDYTLTLWLKRNDMKSRRLLSRIIATFADEINLRINENDWDFADIVEAGAEIIKFRDQSQAEKEAKDEAL